MQTNCILVASTFVINPQISISSVSKIAIFPILVANKIFHVSVVLVVYFCDQIVAPEFVTADVTAVFMLTIIMVFSDENKILIKHINTLSIHSYTCRGIKIGALEMQFVCIFFHMC